LRLWRIFDPHAAVDWVFKPSTMSDGAVIVKRSPPSFPLAAEQQHRSISIQTREFPMPDDTSKSSGQDRARINVNQDYELRDWSKKFGVTPERLKEAVAAVGDLAERVESYLKGGG
jgi:hypothetical protein